MNNSTIIVTPWHNKGQLQKFLEAWGIQENAIPNYLHLEHDKTKKGCALTKNAGIKAAMKKGAETIIILDDDCFPLLDETLEEFAEDHEFCLQPQTVQLFDQVTTPPSRGTPYFSKAVDQMPVAASMGFWTKVGDFDAPAQLVLGQTHPMSFDQKLIYGRYFPLCGMNLAFRVEEFPWCQFIDVERFDDIWQGFLWQRKAWAAGQCFNLYGPMIRHSRQSNVWHNLRVEAPNLERNETIWQKAATMPFTDYETMKKISFLEKYWLTLFQVLRTSRRENKKQHRGRDPHRNTHPLVGQSANRLPSRPRIRAGHPANDEVHHQHPRHQRRHVGAHEAKDPQGRGPDRTTGGKQHLT